MRTRIGKHSLWIFIGLSFLIHLNPAFAVDFDIDLGGLTPTTFSREEFRDFSKEAGLAISYIPAAPAEPLGWVGFDVGVEVTVVDIREDRSYWTDVTDDPPNQLFIPKLHAQKGLPFGFDVGAVYSKIPQSNVSFVGGEIKWALLAGNIAMPALAVRGSYTRMFGVDDLELQTIGADISISKGISFITPYAGYGHVWILSKETSSALNFEQENLSLPKPFIGVKIALLLINFVAEIDFSEVPLYTARLNVGF